MTFKRIIDVVKNYLSESKFYVAHAEILTINNKTFASLFWGSLFHKVTNYKKSLEEIFKILKKFIFVIKWRYEFEYIVSLIKYSLAEEYIKNL